MTRDFPSKARQRLAAPGLIRCLAPYDVFSARILAQAGIEWMFLGGFGASASHLGMPDIGLLTLSEMVDLARRIVAAVDVPVVVDADTGHGGWQNVVRTVRDIEATGAAGLLLEDQTFPKRCGHFAGKGVVPREVMADRLKAALDARRNPDFLIFGRTDARATLGLEEAIERGCEMAELGADVIFVEAPQSVDELAAVARGIPAPQLANMLVGGKTPILSADHLEELGFRLCVSPIETLAVAGWSLRQLARVMVEDGRVDGLAEQMLTFDEIKQSLGLAEWLGPERQ